MALKSSVIRTIPTNWPELAIAGLRFSTNGADILSESRSIQSFGWLLLELTDRKFTFSTVDSNERIGQFRFPVSALLGILVVACLAPFLGKAFHIDDPLFVWGGHQIVGSPWDPYGFWVNWNLFPEPLYQVSQNPPLASYYMAAVSPVVGWSERALHAAFLVPALAAVLGTYGMARKFTRRPLLAALATLAAPGFLVSSTGLMCDVMMVASFTLAILAWLEGLDRKRPLLLASASAG